MAPSGLYARLCHAFLVIIIMIHLAGVAGELFLVISKKLCKREK